MNDPILTDPRLQAAERRAYRYDAQDGLTELMAGIMFFFITRAMIDPHLAWLPALLIFPMRFALKFFKERFTYPRVGYVKLRSEDGKELGRGMLTYLLIILFLAAAALWVFGDITSFTLWKKWMPAIMAGFCSGGFFYMAGKSGFWRHYLLVALCLGWGVACSLQDFPTVYQAIGRWTLGMGLVSLLMGVVVFARFLMTHPVRSREVADEQS
jgi:hypothetical protein